MSGLKKRAMLPAVLALSTAAMMASTSAPHAATPFSKLSGSWKGSGQVRLEGGKSERISCRGYYNVKGGGDGLSLAIRCASPSYRIEMRGNLTDNGGRVSGNWEERTFNASGNLSGRGTANSLNLAISGAISGRMSLSVSGSSHQVSISTSGTGLQGVSISLSRG